MNYLSRYGWDYLSPVGQDSQDIISTDPRLYPQPEVRADRNANALEQYMPQGLVEFGHSVKAAQGKPSLFGKALGAIGLDESGRRGQTSWGDAARATMWLPGDIVQGLADSVHNIAGYGGQAYHTSPEAGDRARAAQLTGDVFNVAGALPMAGAGIGRATGQAAIQDNAAGIFGGRLAKTADHAKLAQAEDMAAKGVPREQIWNDTGWFKGVDGKWRFEIDDSGANVNRNKGRLDRVMSHDNLFDAYPEIGNIRTSPIPGLGQLFATGGYREGHGLRGWLGSRGEIRHAPLPDKSPNILLHETQHAIQKEEGFARGGNPREDISTLPPEQRDMLVSSYVNDAMERQKRYVKFDDDPVAIANDYVNNRYGSGPNGRVTKEEALNLLARSDRDFGHQTDVYRKAADIVRNDMRVPQPEIPQKLFDDAEGQLGQLRYKHGSGEVEARTVERRAKLTQEQRAARPPWLDYDVPESQQIVPGVTRMDGSPLYSNSKESALPGLLRSAQAGEQLPMDTASRMKRAQEMGFDTGRELYHGTDAQFDAFTPSDRGALGPGVYLTGHPGIAGRYGSDVGAYHTRGNILQTGPWKDIPEGLTDRIKGDLTPEERGRWDRLWPKPREENGITYGANPDAETLREVLTRSVEPQRVPQILQKHGYDGIEGIADGHEVVMFDPKNLRRTDAAFDPVQSHSPNLLASNPKESAFLSALAGEQMQQPGITAYHGSPHSFDKFSMDKIGTGEGAQAYGHGLYFAENEGVARQYRDTLSAPVGNDMAQLMLKQHRGDAAAAIADLKSRPGYDISHSMKDAVRRLETGDAATTPGHMYEVRINADPEHFLDWDKPLSQQSEKVQGALSKFDRDMYHPEGADYDPMEPGHTAYQRLAERLSKPISADAEAGWSSVVNTINDKVQNRGSATDFLRDNGVPGIRYLDQGSRGAGEGSRNFVVFDDKLISIVRKYGWAGAAAMLGMSTDDLMSQAQAQQSPGVPASNPLYR